MDRQEYQSLPLDPKTMKNEGFKPQYMGYNPKNEGRGFPW